MAMAEEPTAPGRPGADPTPAPLEPADRLAHLRAFLLDHYELDPDDPRASVDGHQLANQYAVAATDAQLPPPPRARFYQDLRSFGLLVGPGAGNRTKVHGIRPRPHAHPHLADLDARWPTIADDLAALRRDRAVEQAQQSVAGTLAFTRAIAEEAADTVVELMRSAPDVHLRARMASLILDRTIPAVRARESAEPPIDVTATARPTFAEVEAMVRQRMVGDTDVQGPSTAQGSLNGNAQGSAPAAELEMKPKKGR